MIVTSGTHWTKKDVATTTYILLSLLSFMVGWPVAGTVFLLAYFVWIIR